jgi:23S rRNA pseudouridine2605 synthase
MEQLVKSGSVTVDGNVCVDQSREVGDAEVAVRGKTVTPAEMTYFAWHKPSGITTTFSDAHATQTLSDSLPLEIRRYPVFAVGRLDRETEGLLLLTTDGAWSERIIHPRNETAKVYRALVHGSIPATVIEKLRKGVDLEDGPVHPLRVERGGKAGEDEWLEIELREGRNRVVRRMVDAVDLQLLRLVRTKLAGYSLGDLKSGEYRRIDPEEPDED